jgi:hypothetical protein
MHRLFIIGLVILTLGAAALVLADVPNIITYQGKLSNFDGSPANGTHTLTFGIYSASAGGTALWSSGPRSVGVVDGLFTYQLGSNVPLPFDIMSDTSRWLGIKVGSDPEMIPRTRFTSEAFAMHARTADSVSGDHYVFNAGDTIDGDLVLAASGAERVKLAPNLASGGSVGLFDQSEDNTAYMTAGGTGGAWLRLNSPTGQIRVALDAWTNGSSIYLHDSDGLAVVKFDARSSGTGAVTLPEGSIHSDDIANEPGIAVNSTTLPVYLSSSTATDIEVVTITTPNDGYIMLFGKCWVRIADVTPGTTAYAWVQIDQTTGGSYVYPYCQWVGFGSTPNAERVFWPLFVQRIYYKAAGTYTFRLEGGVQMGSGTCDAYDAILTAMYIPTSYGAVETFVTSADAADHESADLQPVREDGQMLGQNSEPMYKVDLRELEVRAARAQAEAERAERELLEAQLREREEQVRR